jgi:hypothetical protein
MLGGTCGARWLCRKRSAVPAMPCRAGVVSRRAGTGCRSAPPNPARPAPLQVRRAPADARRGPAVTVEQIGAIPHPLAPVRHAAVGALYDPGTRNLAEFGRQLGMSRERVRVLLERTGRLNAGGNGRRTRSRPG